MHTARLLSKGFLVAANLATAGSVLAQSPNANPDSGWGATVQPKLTQPHRSPKASAKSNTKTEESLSPPGPMATAASVTGDASRTRLAFDLTAPVGFTVFRMANPFRVVLDLDAVGFTLPPGTGHDGRGLVTAFRYGLFAPGKSRIVIDTSGPARIESAHIVRSGGASRLEISLVPTSTTELAAAELAQAAHSIELKPENLDAAPASASPPKNRPRPVIVIDPGHGGIDPGAQGTQWLEKDIVLAVANEIRRALLTNRRYDIVMTRSGDSFVSLDQRVKLSRFHQADLFISIHADSLAQKDLAQAIRGATVYTLSEKASDDRSRALAEKENAADLLAGLKLASAAADDQVRSILYDLMRRETSNLSTDLRSGLVRELKPRLAMAKDPMRSAPFKVLRQLGSPAVLIELGYISNAEDERQMASQAWQRGVGEAVARAADDFLRRKATRRE